MRPALRFSAPMLIASALLTPLSAQTSGLYSPRAYVSLEGEYSCAMFGAWPAMRYQLIDGENRGTSATLKEVSLRLDYRNHSSWVSAPGRYYSNVTLQLADGDFAQTTNSFTKNLKSTPTAVFSGRVHWPDVNGSPISKPAPWGGISGAYRLPFNTAWKYPGSLDLVSDWSFSGGTLVNQGSWTASTPKGYAFDSFHDPTEPLTGSYRSIPSVRLNNRSKGVTSRCNDSYFGTTDNGSYANMYCNVYGPDGSVPSWRNDLVLWSTSHYTEPGAPVIHGWAFATREPGVEAFTGCNKLHLNGLTLFWTQTAKPASVNPYGYAQSQFITTPWLDIFAAVRIVVQAGWIDKNPGQLRLTQAHEATLPAGKPRETSKRLAIFQVPGSAVVGPDARNLFNPILRY